MPKSTLKHNERIHSTCGRCGCHAISTGYIRGSWSGKTWRDPKKSCKCDCHTAYRRLHIGRLGG